MTAKGEVRQWVREVTRERSEFYMPDLTDEAIEHFSQDPVFIQNFLRECLRELVYAMVQSTVQETRSPDKILLGDLVTTRSGLVKMANTKFGDWIEHAGDRSIHLMDMTKTDLLQAASERERRGSYELLIARLWRKLAQGMKRNETVKDKYTPEQIASIKVELEES